jgi:Zn finger protein HypA/HybF involved in hydrogenase expression
MTKARTQKPSRSIPEHIKRAVNARDRFICQNCSVHTEFIHYDHKFPFDLGGPTTVENIQSLCPKCNTSKGNKIQCHHCRHWMSPDNTKCPQCGTKFPYSKRSQTLAGRLELLSEKVGRVVLIGGAALVLIGFLSCGVYLYRHLGSNPQASEQSANAQTIVNTSFDVTNDKPANFEIIVPASAKNARVVGGYKVTAGSSVNCYVLDGAQRQQAAKESSASARLRVPLAPGTYYLQFVPALSNTSSKVAAEFYLKFD